MERIADIINQLIKEVLHGDKNAMSGPSLVKMLLKEGYDSREIEQALSLVLSLPDMIHAGIEEIKFPTWGQSMRVFTPLERLKLGLDAQGYLLGLVAANLLDHAELEHVLDEAIALQVSPVGVAELQWIVGRVIEDETRSYLLSTAPLSPMKASDRWN